MSAENTGTYERVRAAIDATANVDADEHARHITEVVAHARRVAPPLPRHQQPSSQMLDAELAERIRKVIS